MDWQPMSTAPTDGREVWVTFQWAGRLVGSDSYPYLDDAIAWREIVPGEEQPEPYAAPLKFITASIMPADTRDAEIERLRADVVRLRAEIERLRNAMPSAEEIAYLRRSLPSYGSERNIAVLDRLEAAR